MAHQAIVSADGNEDYSTIQAAVDACPIGREELSILYIKNGTYNERVTVPEGKRIHFIGESEKQTIISYGDYARKIHPDGKEFGTFRTSTLTVTADQFCAENLTVANTSGYGAEIGQAVAVMISSDKAVFHHVSMLGNQDTLYTPGSGRQYYKRCYIEGHVDFIFGSAVAVFDECHIHSLRRGYITAASTPEDVALGYVFFDCELTGNERGTVFLGRPWRPHSSVTFVRTKMADHIQGEGWDNWRNPDNERTSRYAEYGCYGPGAQTERRVPWAKTYRATDIPEFLTAHEILKGDDDWDYNAFIQIKHNPLNESV